MQILAVDDDPVILESLRRLERQPTHPFRYLCAASCSEAIRLLTAAPVAVVLADFVLDDGYGTDLVAFSRGRPVVVMTGQGSESVAVQALRAGAYDYVIKDDAGGFVELVPATIERVLARRRAEDAERQRAAELVQTMRDNRSLEQFAGMLSRSLSTPLQVVQHYCGLMLSSPSIAKDRLMKNYAQAAFDGARRGGALVAEALELARVATVGGRMVGTELTQAVQDAAREVGEDRAVPGDLVRSDELPRVVADPVQLRALLRRLIDRAERRCRQAQQAPVVHVFASRRESEWVVSVEDAAGPHGLNESEWSGVPVEAATADQDHAGGASLGLAICRRIVERHHGSFWLGNGRQGRSAAFFSLPERSELGHEPTELP